MCIQLNLIISSGKHDTSCATSGNLVMRNVLNFDSNLVHDGRAVLHEGWCRDCKRVCSYRRANKKQSNILWPKSQDRRCIISTVFNFQSRGSMRRERGRGWATAIPPRAAGLKLAFTESDVGLRRAYGSSASTRVVAINWGQNHALGCKRECRLLKTISASPTLMPVCLILPSRGSMSAVRIIFVSSRVRCTFRININSWPFPRLYPSALDHG
ncbi:uncharacterized protein EDB91DRAFT_178466 [Suillus paluster]|uniref:uncharacterized protein n=1 Tax=Suillus paluster TaxID=48578 RepID=UPI001B87BCA2|nr:uncharacterized protein EDB91DRAFT_178466 [Suillus paluster]KAG1745131.1 hypothetical protein EDB91DRAFT_178466 [Suillus paluster]